MKKHSIKIKRFTLLFIAVLPFMALFLFSFSYPDYSTERKLTATKFSGEDLFMGIYLRKGIFAPEVKTLNKISTITDNQVSYHFLDLLKKKLLEKDAHFFEKFKEGITSQSHLEVSKTMQNASVMLHDILSKINVKQQNNSLKDSQEVGVEGQGIDLTIDFIIIDNPVIVAVAIVLPLGPPTLPLDKEGKPSFDQSAQNKLSGQMLVEELVQKF